LICPLTIYTGEITFLLITCYLDKVKPEIINMFLHQQLYNPSIPNYPVWYGLSFDLEHTIRLQG